MIKNNTILLFLVCSLTAQDSTNNVAKTTLPALAVQGSTFGSLDISKSKLLGEDVIDSRNISTLEDLNGLSSNLHFSGNGLKSFGDVVSIRGIGNTQLFGSPGVQMYVDGVPQGNVFSYGAELYNLEGVEIFKGPQVAQFGKLAPGGAINLISRKPGNAKTQSVSASFASFNSQKYNLYSAGTIDQHFSYSLSAQRSTSDGFLNNASGQDNHSESWNGKLSLVWDDGSGMKATLGASLGSHKLGAQPIVLRNQSDFYARSVNTLNERTEIEQDQQFLKIEQDLSFGNLSSITTHNDWEMNPNLLDIDFDFGAFTSTISQIQENWSQEIKVQSIDEESNWAIGVFYNDDDIKGKATRFVGMNIDTDYTLDSENIAGFASFGKSVSDIDEIGLALRMDRFDKAMSRTNTLSGSSQHSKDFSGTTGHLNWNRRLSDTASLELKAGYTEKAGGYSAFTSTPGQEEFSEEKISSYEIIFKLTPSNNWGLNLAGFINNVKDYQFELNGAGMDYYLENADKATIHGIEVDSFWSFDGGWSLQTSFGITKSEFKEISALPALKGKQLPFVPDQSFSVSLEHKLENGLTYNIGSRTIGKSYFWDNTGINTADVIDTYTLIDANIEYELDNWNITLFGSNLTDEEYYTSLVSNLGFGNGNAPGIVGSPRVIGLSVSKEF